MSRIIRVRGSVLALVSLVTAVSFTGVGSGFVGVESARADDLLPVTSSFTGGTFTATFPGDDSALSFAADTDPLDPFLTTGGGWISTFTGGKGTFGFIGGTHMDGTFFGHVVYVDHDANFRMVSTSITFFAPGCNGTVAGFGESSSGQVQFSIHVQDNGEPGSDDVFVISAYDAGTGSTVYAWLGTLQGGDIQAHGMVCL
jgi:hypothetical protein